VYNHEPPDYICPFCKVAAGLEDEASYTVASDIVLRTNLVIGFISSHWWPCNPGHVILIP
jgi:histidine triad (HIT) family protein